jgi:TetR/AcrR family transcriptional regulator of autoinduction and epiphytic fitness
MTEGKKTLGRPQTISAEERRSLILDSAAHLFIHDGYNLTNMDKIAQRCGMSKKTLYQVFENKEALFSALVCDVTRHKSETSVLDTEIASPKDLKVVLMQLASWVLQPRQIGFVRLVIAEALVAPDLATRFRNHAIEHGRQLIRQCIEKLIGPKGANALIAEELASIVFGAVIADIQLRALVGEDISELAGVDAMAERIERVVSIIEKYTDLRI